MTPANRKLACTWFCGLEMYTHRHSIRIAALVSWFSRFTPSKQLVSNFNLGGLCVEPTGRGVLISLLVSCGLCIPVNFNICIPTIHKVNLFRLYTEGVTSNKPRCTSWNTPQSNGYSIRLHVGTLYGQIRCSNFWLSSLQKELFLLKYLQLAKPNEDNNIKLAATIVSH